MESHPVELLICAVEDFMEKEFPSPRSYKRDSEIEFAHLLAGRLFQRATRAQIKTMLGHFHNRRLGERRSGRPSTQRRQL
jgi:hypothetical protein